MVPASFVNGSDNLYYCRQLISFHLRAISIYGIQGFQECIFTVKQGLTVYSFDKTVYILKHIITGIEMRLFHFGLQFKGKSNM